MITIAVIAHSGKTFGGGLGQLRGILQEAGYAKPLWYEVAKSRQIPDCARQAMSEGADLIFIWGGDGSVQQCINAVVGCDAIIAILPAGTANLLAKNLGIPQDLETAVQIGLHGVRSSLDTGTVNGEHFAVMAGAGIDARMIRDTSTGLKSRFGRVAYFWSGAKALGDRPLNANVEVDGRKFFHGKITCILVGNVSKVFAGVEVFDGSQCDDGVLEFGVIIAKTPLQWVRTISRVAFGRTDKSPFVVTARGKSMEVTFDHSTVYELDGGIRKAEKKLRIKVHPSSVTVCVPAPDYDHKRGRKL